MDTAGRRQQPRKRLRAPGILLIVLAAAALVLLLFRLAGVRIYVMASSSMEEAISVGDLVVVTPKSYDRIHPGDVITFAADPSGQTATHRVIAKNEAEQTFVTKGDSSAAPDEPAVPGSSVVGVVSLVVPGAGALSVFLATLQGKILLGLLFAIFVVTVLLIALCRGKKKSGRFPAEK